MGKVVLAFLFYAASSTYAVREARSVAPPPPERAVPDDPPAPAMPALPPPWVTYAPPAPPPPVRVAHVAPRPPTVRPVHLVAPPPIIEPEPDVDSGEDNVPDVEARRPEAPRVVNGPADDGCPEAALVDTPELVAISAE